MLGIFNFYDQGIPQTREGLYLLSAHEELQILLQLGSPTAQTLLTVITFSSIVPSLKMVNITLLFIKMAYLFKIINIQSGHYACMKFNTQIIYVGSL